MQGEARGPSRDDVDIALAVRRELGPGSEDQAVDVFLDRVGRAIDERVDERLDHRLGRPGAVSGGRSDGSSTRLAIASIALGIPVTGASSALGGGGVVVAIIAWIAIAVVNLAHSMGRFADR